MAVTIKGSTAPNIDDDLQLYADYVSIVEELYKSIPHPGEFSDAETMHDEITRIYDSLHKFMGQIKAN